MKPIVETSFKKKKNLTWFTHFIEHLEGRARVLPQTDELEIKSMDLGFGSSNPCTPLPLSTSLTCPVPQTSTGATLVVAVIIDAGGPKHCRHTAPVADVEETP